MANPTTRCEEGCLAAIGKHMQAEDWRALAKFFTQEAITRAEANEGFFDAEEYLFAAIAAFRALGGADQVPPAWMLCHLSGRGFPLPDPTGKQVDRTMAERARAYELLPHIDAVVQATNSLFKQMDQLKHAVKELGPDTEEEGA